MAVVSASVMRAIENDNPSELSRLVPDYYVNTRFELLMGKTPLEFSLFLRSPHCVRSLIKRGALKNPSTDQEILAHMQHCLAERQPDQAILWALCRSATERELKILNALENDAHAELENTIPKEQLDTRLETYLGQTPLELALLFKSVRCVKTLLSHGAKRMPSFEAKIKIYAQESWQKEDYQEAFSWVRCYQAAPMELKVLDALQNDDDSMLGEIVPEVFLDAPSDVYLGNKPVNLAIYLEKPHCAKYLLSRHVDRDPTLLKRMHTYMEYYQQQGDNERALLWLECCAIVRGVRTWDYAIADHNIELVELLAAQGLISHNTPDLQRWLHFVIQTNDKVLFRRLLALGIRCIVPELWEGMVKNGDGEWLEIFLSLVRRPQDFFLTRALYEASKAGHVGIVKRLLEVGANPNEYLPRASIPSDQSPPSYTPLAAALANRHEECFDLLLNSGAYPDEEALLDAVLRAFKERGAPIDAAKKLILAGANPSAVLVFEGVQDSILSGLLYDPNSNHVELANLLVEHGAYVERFSPLVRSPLSRALDGGLCDLVDRLLKAGASVFSDEDDRSLLGTAVWCDHCIAQLLKHGVRPSRILRTLWTGGSRGNSSRTIKMGTELEEAANVGRTESIGCLLEAGAEPSFAGARGLRNMIIVTLEGAIEREEIYDIPENLEYIAFRSYRFCKQSCIQQRAAYKHVMYITKLFRSIEIPVLCIDEIFSHTPHLRDHLIHLFLSILNTEHLDALFSLIYVRNKADLLPYEITLLLTSIKPHAIEFLCTTIGDALLPDLLRSISSLWRPQIEDEDLGLYIASAEWKNKIKALVTQGIDEAFNRCLERYKTLKEHTQVSSPQGHKRMKDA